MDSSKNGVIYISLGSNLKSANLPTNVRENMLNAFKLLPYNIIWKWETESLPGKPKNVLLKKWLPQANLLGELKKSKTNSARSRYILATH